MRQYGSPAGTDYESNRAFNAPSARAIEKRLGEELAREQLDAHELGPEPCDGLCMCDEDDFWDDELGVFVCNRPLTHRIGDR